MSDPAPLSSLDVPTTGQLVRVRQRRFVVTGVVKSSIAARPFLRPDDGVAVQQGPQHLVQLLSVDDEGLGEELSVVWELEPGTQVFERTALPDPSRGFDEPARLDAFLDAVRWGTVASADIRSIHAPFRSGVTLEDYQLDPVVRAVEMPRVSLLIADDVGLGKTIEAGLVLQELLLRYRARSVLVVCPAGLQLQWRDQMRDKFGLEFHIVDAASLRDLRRRRGLQVNPWTHFPRLITSVDFLKRERTMRMFREALPAPGEPTYPRRFDVLLVDEAHNVAPSGRGQYAIDSMRTECIRTLSPHFEHKLFLSATPHNGYTESFGALLELLDDQRFHRGMTPDRVQLSRVLVRRLKKELPPDDLGRPRFPARSLDALEVDFEESELEVHSLLREYAALRAQGDKDEDETVSVATRFVTLLLKKRLFSSPEAFRITLEAHCATLRGENKQSQQPRQRVKPGILQREIARLEEDFDRDESHEEETESLVRTVSRTLRPLDSKETALVNKMLAWAERASAQLDAKAKTMLGWLESTVRTGKRWNNERVIIFTEYRATQKWLADKLAVHGFADGDRLLTLYGGMNPEERERVKHAFQADPAVSHVRILLATDAASEGIDLQNYCSRLVHYEIPWNPNRLEQRNGRVDRHGQRAPKVQIFHFVGKGWHEQRIGRDVEPGTLVGDLEFLYRAALKVDTIREDLGNTGDVIATQVEEAMLGKRRDLDTERSAPRASAARRMLSFEKHLEKRLHELTDRLQDSRKQMHIEAHSLKAVVDVALDMAGRPGLTQVQLPGRDGEGNVLAWQVPALDGTWAACLEGLPHPHTKEMRPITFDHEVARDRDDVVLAHLGHRLVQMCVALLRAEVWAPDEQRKLSRVSARTAGKISHPMVVAHARLVVLGQDGTRLHEELFEAGGALVKGVFNPLGHKELRRMLESVSQEEARAVPVELQRELSKLWPSHEKELRQSIESYASARQEEIAQDLNARCAKEIKDHEAILKELQHGIETELKNSAQLEMFDQREKEQFEQNREALKVRSAAIPEEIRRETAAIRERYREPSGRLFPVALTYLVPSSMVRR